jgi:hypothetical protein
MIATLLAILLILTGQPQQRFPAEDDARHELVWRIAGAALGQSPDKGRVYEVTRHPVHRRVVTVALLEQGTECMIATFYLRDERRWTPLEYTCP